MTKPLLGGKGALRCDQDFRSTSWWAPLCRCPRSVMPAHSAHRVGTTNGAVAGGCARQGRLQVPQPPLDGEAIWYHSRARRDRHHAVQPAVLDNPLTEGRWYYYTLFLCIADVNPPTL